MAHLVALSLSVPFEPLTVYHVNPRSYSPTPLNMDTGDDVGDMYFDMRTKALPLECAAKPKSADCSNAEVVADDLVVTKLTLDVRLPFGSYGMCNVCVNGTDHQHAQRGPNQLSQIVRTRRK